MKASKVFAAVVVAALTTLFFQGVAGATIHDINSSECAAPPADGTAADTQDPPGVSDPSSPAFLQPLESTLFEGNLQAANGDSGDEQCVFPETTSHGNAAHCPTPPTPENCPDEHAGEDGELPSGGTLPGEGPA